jgi:hypothetical protein
LDERYGEENVRSLDDLHRDPLSGGPPGTHPVVEAGPAQSLLDSLLREADVQSLVSMKVRDLPVADEETVSATPARGLADNSGEFGQSLLELLSCRHRPRTPLPPARPNGPDLSAFCGEVVFGNFRVTGSGSPPQDKNGR